MIIANLHARLPTIHHFAACSSIPYRHCCHPSTIIIHIFSIFSHPPPPSLSDMWRCVNSSRSTFICLFTQCITSRCNAISCHFYNDDCINDIDMLYINASVYAILLLLYIYLWIFINPNLKLEHLIIRRVKMELERALSSDTFANLSLTEIFSIVLKIRWVSELGAVPSSAFMFFLYNKSIFVFQSTFRKCWTLDSRVAFTIELRHSIHRSSALAKLKKIPFIAPLHRTQIFEIWHNHVV